MPRTTSCAITRRSTPGARSAESGDGGRPLQGSGLSPQSEWSPPSPPFAARPPVSRAKQGWALSPRICPEPRAPSTGRRHGHRRVFGTAPAAMRPGTRKVTGAVTRHRQHSGSRPICKRGLTDPAPNRRGQCVPIAAGGEMVTPFLLSLLSANSTEMNRTHFFALRYCLYQSPKSRFTSTLFTAPCKSAKYLSYPKLDSSSVALRPHSLTFALPRKL